MKVYSKYRILLIFLIHPLLTQCSRNDSDMLSFFKNEQNGMIRFQAFVHGRIEPDQNDKNYDFVLKQAENVQGIFQIDSTNPKLRIRFIKTNFLFGTETDCTNTNLGSTYSCKIEVKDLEKARYRLRIFSESRTNDSNFNLFAGIFGNGYVQIE